MNELTKLLIWTIVIGILFGLAWKQGWLLRLAAFVAETREELRKCTWPSVDELKGHTAVIMISIGLLGLFTVLADLILSKLVPLLTTSV